MAVSSTAIDPHDPPAIIEVFSNSARAWFVALVVSIKDEILVLRFIDESGTKLEKRASCKDPRVVAYGTHTTGILPPGVSRVASRQRPGESAYLYAVVHRKFGTPALAWQAYLERELLEATPMSPESPTGSDIRLHLTPQDASPSSVGCLSFVSEHVSAASQPSSVPLQSSSSHHAEEPVRSLEMEFAKHTPQHASGSGLLPAHDLQEEAAQAQARPRTPATEVEEIDFGFARDSRWVQQAEELQRPSMWGASAATTGIPASQTPVEVQVAKPASPSAEIGLVAACAAEAARAAEMAQSIAAAVNSRVGESSFPIGTLLMCKKEAPIIASPGSQDVLDRVQPGSILMVSGQTHLVANRNMVSVMPHGFVHLDCFEERSDARTHPPDVDLPNFDHACSALLIWLHGLNGSSNDWVPFRKALSKKLPWVNFCFPDAALRPMTCQKGRCMQAWFDVPRLPVTGNEEMSGMVESITIVRSLLFRATSSGFPAHRIVLGGLSQGATVALQVGLTYERKLAGICALSGWVPQSIMHGIRQPDLPVFMGHGDQDKVVPMPLSEQSATGLVQAGCQSVQLLKYRGLNHAFVTAEFEDVEEFLTKHLPMNWS